MIRLLSEEESPIHGTVNISSLYLNFMSLLQYLIDSLLTNMKSFFSDVAVKLLASSSIFNPALLSSEEGFSQYRKEEIKALAQFYGSEATVSYDGETYTSPPLLGRDNLIGECSYSKGH